MTKRPIYSVRQIKQQFQKPFHLQNPYHWLVSRRISAYLTYLLQYTRIVPNHVTLFGLLLGLLACGALGSLGFHWRVVALIGLHLHDVLDCVDGELARVKQRFSAVGQFLDYLMHYFVDGAKFLALALGAMAAGLPWYWPALLALGSLTSVMGRVLGDLPFRVIVADAKPERQPIAAIRISRARAGWITHLFGLAPKLGFAWKLIPFILSLAAALVIERLWGLDLFFHVGLVYSLAQTLSLGIRIVDLIRINSVQLQSKWLFTFPD